MRRKPALIQQENYTPNHLLDTLMAKLGAKSDAALARALKVPPSTISKVRHRQVVVNSEMLIEAHEQTEMSIRELRDLMGDTQSRFWLGRPESEKKERAMRKMPMVDRMVHPAVANAAGSSAGMGAAGM